MCVQVSFFTMRVGALCAALLTIPAPFVAAQKESPGTPAKGRDHKTSTSRARSGSRQKNLQESRCQTAGDEQITITCEYGHARHAGNDALPPSAVMINS